MGEDFSFIFTDHNFELNAEFYDSLRIWPQTRICYAVMEDDSIKVLPIEVKMFHSANPPNCDEFTWKTTVKWTCKNENQ